MAFRGILLSGVAYPRSRETRRTLNNKTGRKRAIFFEIAHPRKVKQMSFIMQWKQVQIIIIIFWKGIKSR